MGDGRSGESSTPVPAKPDVGLVKPDECQGPPLGQPTRVELVTAMLKGMQPPRATQASVGAEPQKPQQSEANSKYVLPGYVTPHAYTTICYLIQCVFECVYFCYLCSHTRL